MNQKVVKRIRKYNVLMGYKGVSLEQRNKQTLSQYKALDLKGRTQFNKSLKEQL